MLYALLRAIAGVALRWYYSRIDAEGLERVPPDAPVLLAVNHPNALVDALVVGWVFPRRVVMTAKATLFGNPLLGWFFRAAGVVPLVRAQDVVELGATSDRERNARAFAALIEAQRRGHAVLIFPEGVTGDWPSLAPIRTGAARIALTARTQGVRGLTIVPIGLTFERKDAPRTRVFAQVGEPIDVDAWPGADADAVPALTAEIERRLRAVTLNFESADDAARATALASLLARLFSSAAAAPPVWAARTPLGDQVAIARRVEEARVRLSSAPESLRARVDALLVRLARFDAERRQRRLVIEDLRIALDVPSGMRFVLREVPILLLAGPFALWGWMNHAIPFNLARLIAGRSVESAADPAMRTIVSGLALVLLFYAAQGAVVFALFGGLVAALYLVSLPIAAEVNFAFRARLGRVVRRARAYLLLRRDPELRTRMESELRWLRNEAAAIDAVLQAGFAGASTS